MLPHPDTISILTDQRRQDLLATADRRRRAHPDRSARRRPAVRAIVAALTARAARVLAWLQSPRGVEVGERLPPPARADSSPSTVALAERLTPMRRLRVVFPLALVLPLVVAPAARVAPAPPPPTPIGLFDVFRPEPTAAPIAGGPVGGPLGISILGFGRLALSPGSAVELPGPQALVVVAGSPLVTPVAGIVTLVRAGGKHGRALNEPLPVGGAVRLQPGDWLFLRSGSACVIASEGPDEVLAFVAMLTGGPAAA